ncbi:MAG: putative toxin-antitoxin system toxin component, PIN family [Proteobacteria bacterium]|nr:putative toxin-antitoxin system toxin component, PIN family [Pseudomonadota bacterium]
MRLVLDTNVVLDLVVFRDPGAATLRAAIEAGRVTILTSAECLAELRRVLDYPEFKLDEAAQAAACDWFVAHAEILEAPEPEPMLPRCRDADDQKFLDLAWVADVEHLVTKDKALLELARRVAKLGRFTVIQTGDLAGHTAGG